MARPKTNSTQKQRQKPVLQGRSSKQQQPTSKRQGHGKSAAKVAPPAVKKDALKVKEKKKAAANSLLAGSGISAAGISNLLEGALSDLSEANIKVHMGSRKPRQLQDSTQDMRMESDEPKVHAAAFTGLSEAQQQKQNQALVQPANISSLLDSFKL